MSSARIDVVSVYIASGPPGARCRRANAITVTPASTATPSRSRCRRYLPTTRPPDPLPAPAGGRGRAYVARHQVFAFHMSLTTFAFS